MTRLLLVLCLLFAAGSLHAQQPTYDIILLGGRVVDGSGNPWYEADIGIANGRIVAIGRLKANDATRAVDVRGLVVAPGFIDVHTHAGGDGNRRWIRRFRPCWI